LVSLANYVDEGALFLEKQSYLNDHVENNQMYPNFVQWLHEKQTSVMMSGATLFLVSCLHNFEEIPVYL
jgi:hypothetical protein